MAGPNKKMGRPKKTINKEQFEKLCSIQCTQEEIASVFGCCEDTITNWCKETYNQTFSEAYKNYSAGGKSSLRRYQFDLAKTNATMAIWLGKQWLGQKDAVEVEHQSNGVLTDMIEALNEYKKTR